MVEIHHTSSGCYQRPTSGEHNLGMYRGQVFGPKEVGLHWQIHKHGADHAAAWPDGKMPVAICIGGPPELIFSAIAPLPDNLEEYMFAGFWQEAPKNNQSTNSGPFGAG